MAEAEIFVAGKIITMDAARPAAEAVAVQDGRVVGVGSLAEMKALGPARINDIFAGKVLMPGFVEGHAHVLAGGVWQSTFVGYVDRTDPQGKVWTGLRTLDAVVDRLAEQERKMPPGDAPLMAWGFDPIFFGGSRMTVEHLDRVSTTRPIFIMHQSFHALNVNRPVLDQTGIDATTTAHGIVRDAKGRPTGELREQEVMQVAMRTFDVDMNMARNPEQGLRNYGRMSNLSGTTTITDLYAPLPESEVALLHRVTADPDFPVRMLPAFWVTGAIPEAVDRLTALRRTNTDKLRFGIVKLVTDGAIQTYTARLSEGYFDGAPNGLWNTAAPRLKSLMAAFHQAGHQVHIHTNGDEASGLALDLFEQVLAESPRAGHRHTLQHCQLADERQFIRARDLGLCTNIFANHIYFYGDIHHAQTLGPQRAARMDAAGTARRVGVHFAIHSDAPVTPLGPLFTAWVAANRKTISGRTLGENERLAVGDALYAITMGAAYTLKMDHEIGSIAPGKFADFAALEQDPLSVAAADLKDIAIAGTVLGGRAFPLPAAA